jgi:glycosyltransferase involved in cell wall biosynthesis
MKKLKLLLLADANSPHTIKWVEFFVVSNHVEVFVFTLNSCKTTLYSDFSVPVCSFFTHSELPRNVVGFTKLNYLRALPKLKDFIKKIKPDIIHAHYASSYGLLASLSGFHPFVLSVWGSDIFSFPKKSLIHKFIVKKNLQIADRVAATGHILAQETQKYTNKEISITPFGIDIEFFKKSENKLSRDEFIVGTVKSLETVYGINYLIEAFSLLCKKHPDKALKLMIVGDGSQKNALIQICEQHNIRDKVMFTGYIEKQNLPQYYNMLDVFVALSLSESFGVAVLEACSCSIPVVVSNVGGLPEIVKDGVSGFIVQSENSLEASIAIETLMNNPELSKTLGENGRKRVEMNYNWEKNATVMLDIYKEVIRKYNHI